MADQLVTDATATLAGLRVRLQRGPLESIAERRALINFIDAALRKEDGETSFDVFCSRAAAGHLADRCDDLATALGELIAAEDRFVKESGMALNDAVAEAVERARPLVKAAA